MGNDNPAYSPTRQTQRETASQRGRLRFEELTFLLVGAGNIDQTTLTNTGSDTRIVELVTAYLIDDWQEAVTVDLLINDGEPEQSEFGGHIPQYPLMLSPGVSWLPGEDLVCNFRNGSNDQVDAIVNIGYILPP